MLLSKRQSSKRQLIRWIGTVTSTLLFLWLLTKQDWQEIRLNLEQLPFWLITLALSLYLIGMLANSLRWYIVLQAPKIRIPFKESTKLTFTGAFISNFLPSTIGGDTFRVFGLLRYTADRATSLASVVLDRLINVSAFITILPLTTITFGSLTTLLKELMGTLSILPTVGFFGLNSQHRKGMNSKFRAWLERGIQTFQIWINHPTYLLGAFIVSWFSIFVIFIAIWTLARGLRIQIALYQVMGVTVITYLITILPISINGYGLREITIAFLYTRLGASIEQATTLAIITRLMALTVTLPGALWLPHTFSSTGQPDSNTPEKLSSLDIKDDIE